MHGHMDVKFVNSYTEILWECNISTFRAKQFGLLGLPNPEDGSTTSKLSTRRNIPDCLICINTPFMSDLINHYTGCNRRNGPDFGKVFLRSNYTDITQNTYIQTWMVTEILAREKSGLLWCLRTVLVSVTSFSPLLELHSYVRANVAPAT